MRGRFLLLGTVGLFLVAAGAACGDGGSSAAPTPSDAGADGAVASSLCPDGKPVAWPPGPYDFTITSTVPSDVTFESPDGPVHIADYFEPCATRSRLLVVRTTGAWCGSCIWHLTHTKRLLDDPRFSDRLELLDLLVSDEDNMPPDAAAVTRWRTRIDAAQKVAIDTDYKFRTALLARSPLPEYVAIDTRTMTVRFAMGDPSPEALQNRIVVELARLDGQPRPSEVVPKLYDELLTENQWALVQDMKLVDAPPADPTNEYGDVAAAAAFGKTLFSDKQLSPSGTVSCATCHDSTKGFGDGVAQAVGVTTGDRNSPAATFAAHARWQFWDGRADTLWMQALGPFENPKEFASSRLYVAHQIATRYATDYNAVFGAKYTLPDISALPAAGKPGDASWQSMTADQQAAVTRIYVNVGKAIAAFERSIRVQPNALDRYAGGDTTALTADQKKALQGFMIGGCAQCHWGPRLTDDAFHVVRFPTGRQDHAPDRGRIDVLPNLPSGEFIASSQWSDAPQSAKLLTLASAPSTLGAFKTPPLRGLPQTAPYGHGGTFPTLLDVAKHYGTRAKDVGDDKATGTLEEWLPEFDANVQGQLPAILQVLDATPL